MTRFKFRRFRTWLIYSVLMVYSASSFSQHTIEIRYEPDAKGGTVFSCTNNAYCTYILDLGFTTLNNLKCDRPLPFHGEVKPGYTRLFTISTIDPQLPTQFNYIIKNQKGCMHPVVNADFTYLLPISPGRKRRVMKCRRINFRILLSTALLILQLAEAGTPFPGMYSG